MKSRTSRGLATVSWLLLGAVLGCAASATGNDTLTGDGDDDEGTGGTAGDAATGGSASGSGGSTSGSGGHDSTLETPGVGDEACHFASSAPRTLAFRRDRFLVRMSGDVGSFPAQAVDDRLK